MYVDFSPLVIKSGATSGRTDTICIVAFCAFHVWDVLGISKANRKTGSEF
jgi:hypothetical protein